MLMVEIYSSIFAFHFQTSWTFFRHVLADVKRPTARAGCDRGHTYQEEHYLHDIFS